MDQNSQCLLFLSVCRVVCPLFLSVCIGLAVWIKQTELNWLEHLLAGVHEMNWNQSLFLMQPTYSTYRFLDSSCVNEYRHRACRIARDCPHDNGDVKCRLTWRFRGQALLLRVLHVVACDNVRDCVFLKDFKSCKERVQLIWVKLFVTN